MERLLFREFPPEGGGATPTLGIHGPSHLGMVGLFDPVGPVAAGGE